MANLTGYMTITRLVLGISINIPCEIVRFGGIRSVLVTFGGPVGRFSGVLMGCNTCGRAHARLSGGGCEG